MWCNFVVDSEVFKISNIPETLGAKTYVLESISLDLLQPFSQLVSKKVDSVKELFLEDCLLKITLLKHFEFKNIYI